EHPTPNTEHRLPLRAGARPAVSAPGRGAAQPGSQRGAGGAGFTDAAVPPLSGSEFRRAGAAYGAEPCGRPAPVQCDAQRLPAGRSNVGRTPIATGQSPSVAAAENSKANAALQRQSPFDRIISLHPEPSCLRLKRGKPSVWEHELYSVSLGDMGQPHVSSGDVW